MIDIKDAVNTIDAYRKLVNEVAHELNACDDEINECDKAFGDIRHCCELNYPLTRSQKSTICKIMREFSRRRRAAKDKKYVLEPLFEYLTDGKAKLFEIGKMANEMNRRYEFVTGERKYVPRVLSDIFEQGSK